MSPRWFALTTGFLASTLLVNATAWAQASRQPASLAERMAAMRRGWSQGTGQSAEQRDAVTADDEQSDGEGESDSLFPNFFSRRAVNAAAPTTSQSHGRSSQPVATINRPAATIATPRAGSAQPTAEDFTLPGLGGSPLPKTQIAPGTTSPGGPDISREIVDDYPVIRGESPGTSPPVTPSNSPSSYATRPGTSTAIPSSSGTAAPRQSPSRRTVQQVNPNDLRRELTGSFGESSSGGGPSARTARSNAPAAEASNNPFGDSKNTIQKPSPVRDTYAPQATISGSVESTWGEHEIEPEPADISEEPAKADASRAFGTTGDLGSAFGSASQRQSPQNSGSPLVRPSARSQQAFGQSATFDSQRPGTGDPTVLVSNQTPVITTDIRGPKQILVGREASYRVQLRNQGDTAAEGIVATIRIPAWAEVVDTNTSQGMIQQTRSSSDAADLQWQVSRLEARGSETLDVRLVPRASRPLELGVSWTLTPVGSRAVVEVQEPKLQMTVGGPDEVLFSEPQLFRLTLTNPGTGPAENVKIELMPPGGGQEVATSHPIGDLPAGASQTVEVELTAREAGKLFVKAIASAEGGLTSEAAKEIFCRKPELEVDWRGPETKYAGTPATYFFRVRNPGTAAAQNVTVQVKLPAGTEFTSASDGQSFDAQQRQIEWQIGSLGPGDDSYMELKCVVNNAGANQFQISATSTTGDLTVSKLAETNVIALADLKLDVSDPSGPVAVGEHALYEIRVQNRGANTAKEVNIVALFSEGIEPDQVEGAMYTVADGRVTFRTIDELPAGRDITLRIRARGTTAGTHIFRAEVLCRDLDIKLATEETTRFYADDIQPEAGSAVGHSGATAETFGPTAR